MELTSKTSHHNVTSTAVRLSGHILSDKAEVLVISMSLFQMNQDKDTK